MTAIQLNKDLPEEFFSDILITAFDGSYGSSWMWFGSAAPQGEPCIKIKHVGEPHSGYCTDDLWMSAHVRLQENYETGNDLFDDPKGFVIDHQSIAGAISRIINDDYLGIWREARPDEEDEIDNETYRGVWKGVVTEHGTGYMVETGETARGCRSILTRAVQDVEAGDIDAGVADAIIQVAAFGKVIFS